MASGDTLAVLHPADADPQSGTFADFNDHAAASGRRPFRGFSPTTEELCIWTVPALVSAYGGGGFTVTVSGSQDTANTATKKIRAEIAIERIQVGDAMGSGGNDFAAGQAASITVDNDVDDYYEGDVTLTDGAQIDSVAVGDKFRVKLTRKVGHADDDALGIFQNYRILIKET